MTSFILLLMTNQILLLMKQFSFFANLTLCFGLHEQWSSLREKRGEEKSGLTLVGGSGQMKVRYLLDEMRLLENRPALYGHC